MNLAVRRNPVARAFTLIELIAVIIVLAILSGVAIPKYMDYSSKAKESSCRGTLGAVRSAIANFYANEAVKGSARFPTLTELTTWGGTGVMQEPIPANPYVAGADASSIESADGKWVAPTSSAPMPAQPGVAGGKGWCYDATTGKFWANSSSGAAENTW